jgi:ATP-dependent DNA helicase PIF1
MVVLQRDQARVAALVEGGGNHVVVGRAGTGKSVLESVLGEGRDTIYLGPTGMSVKGRKRGWTVAKFIGASEQSLGDCGRMIMEFNAPLLAEDILGSQIFIDECFMVSGLEFVALEAGLRRLGDKTKAFGGIRVVMFGDPRQLPPPKGVKRIFGTAAYRSCRFEVHELKQQLRQQDMDEEEEMMMRELLESMRSGKFSARTEGTLQYIVNGRTIPDGIPHLFSKVMLVERHNNRELAKLDGGTLTLKRRTSGRAGKTDITWAKKTVRLRPGARVMVMRNVYDKLNNLVVSNGSMGEYITNQLNANSEKMAGRHGGVGVRLDGEVGIRMVTSVKTAILDSDKQEVGIRYEYPLMLAWGMTIHRAQGLTLDKVVVHGESMFEPNQAYVGVSRVRRLQDLYGVGLVKKCFEIEEDAGIHEFMEKHNLS